MRKGIQLFAALALSASAATACGGHDKGTASTSNGDATMNNTTPASAPSATAPASAPVAQEPAPHHSKLGGAAAGAVVGHMLGGHAVAGAAAGALIQHERNKH